MTTMVASPQPEQESRAGRGRAVFDGRATSPASGAPIRKRRRRPRAGRGKSVGLKLSMEQGRVEIGRAPCGDRICSYVEILVGDGFINTNRSCMSSYN